MDSESRTFKLISTKTMVCGKEGEIGVETRVIDKDRLAVKIPVSVPVKLEPAPELPFHPARACDLAAMLYQNYSNFKRSGEPARFMRYVDGSWVDVEADVFEAAKTRFLGGIPSVDVEIGGSKCLFDLHRMIELNLDTGSFRSIAWIDVKGMCFFPKSVVSSPDGENDLVDFDEDSKNEVANANGSHYLVRPELEIEIKITQNAQKEANNSNDNKVELNKMKRKSKDTEIVGLDKDKAEGSASNFVAKKKHVEEIESPVTAVPAQKCAPNTANAFYVKLISKLRSSLPPPKLLELQTLIRSLKDRKPGRDVFIRELAAIVGDEVLRSAVQELRR